MYTSRVSSCHHQLPLSLVGVLSFFPQQHCLWSVLLARNTGSAVSFPACRHLPSCTLPSLRWTWLQDPDMPKGKEAVDLARAGFRQVGEHRYWHPCLMASVVRASPPAVGRCLATAGEMALLQIEEQFHLYLNQHGTTSPVQQRDLDRPCFYLVLLPSWRQYV